MNVRRHRNRYLSGWVVVGAAVLLMVMLSVVWDKFPSAETGLDGPEPRIFVSMASYRDRWCPSTLLSMYLNATTPSRVRVSLVEQVTASDVRCVSKAKVDSVTLHPIKRAAFRKWLRLGVMVTYVDAADAKGPAYARYTASLRMRPDDAYFLMIDSHTRFEPKWDATLIAQLTRTEATVARKAVLSYHPLPFDLPASEPSSTPLDVLCDVGFHPLLGVPIVFGRQSSLAKTEEGCLALQLRGDVIPQPLTCAGFLFARTALVHEVPFTDAVPYVFHGEEILLTVRAFAKGWRFFRPCHTVVRHKYERVDEPSVWRDVAVEAMESAQDEAYATLQAVLRLTEYNSTIPMSTKKTIPAELLLSRDEVDAYWAFAHINPITRLMNMTSWNCT